MHLKSGDLVRFLIDDHIMDLDGSRLPASSPSLGIVIRTRAETVDILRNGRIDLMVPVGWLEIVDETG